MYRSSKMFICYLPIFLVIITFLIAPNCNASCHDFQLMSVGNYNSSNFTWAVGVNPLELTLNNFLICSGTAGCSMKWKLGNITLYSVVNFNRSKTCNSNSNEFLDQSCKEMVFQYPPNNPRYNLTCMWPSDNMNSRFALLNQLDQGNMSVHLCIQYQVNSTAQSCDINKTLQINYCNQFDPGDNNIVSMFANKSVYESIATFKCKNITSQALVVDGIYKEGKTTHNLTCGYTAEWEGSKDMSCWFAPQAALEIFPNSTVRSGDQIELKCSCTEGNPVNVTSKIYWMNDVETNHTTMTTSSDINQFHFSCQCVNAYIQQVNSQSGKSVELIINVLYQPEKEAGTTNSNAEYISAKENETINLVYEFSANPAIQDVKFLNFTVEFANYNSVSNASMKYFDLDNSQLVVENAFNSTFSYTIQKAKTADSGLYTLTVYSPDEHFSSPLVISTNVTVESGSGSHPVNKATKLGIIIGCAVAGTVLLILICIIIYLIVKRQRHADETGNQKRYATTAIVGEKEERINPIYGSAVTGEKEERNNPLYGTAGADVSDATYTSVVKKKNTNAHKKSEKEEKINPLYNHAATKDHVVEEAYTAVVTKKQNGGNENPVFIAGSGDTYTEVIKKKKEKNDLPESDVMYAEVQKKNKKKKEGDNLHGS